jgi:replication factor C subunit 1
MRGTIANALMKIAAKENISITKNELEEMCEKNGNDIRAILNALEFYSGSTSLSSSEKDSIHRLDLFSASQKLFSNKRATLSQSEDYVYVDYHMIPLAVQEAYASASTSVEELEAASDILSHGDCIDKTIWRTQDWSLLPVSVTNTVCAVKSVKGNAPFNIFPQFLGKNSKRMKHMRWMEDTCKKMKCDAKVMRLDYTEPLLNALLQPLLKGNIKEAISGLDACGLSRDDLMALSDVCFDQVEIPTKIKTSFTREWNKTHGDMITQTNRKKRKVEELHFDESDESDESDELDELEKDMEELLLE